MKTLLSVISFVVELLIAYSFLYDIFVPKKKTFKTILTIIAIYTILFIAFILFDNTLVNILLHILGNFLFAYLCFESGFKNSFLSSLFLVAAMTCTEFMAINILSIGESNNIYTYESNLTAYVLTIVFSKITYFIIIRISMLTGFIGNQKNKTPLFLFLFPACALIILYTFWKIAISFSLASVINVTISIASLAVTVSVILTYVFYGQTSKKMDELYKSQSELERINTDKAYYAMLDQQNKTLQTFAHDEKNHLTAIKSLAKNPQVDEYIDNIYGQIKCHSMFGNTKNKMLDLILNKYQYICDQYKIEFYSSIKTANLSYIENSDLITMLSNLLDNAVEAAKHTINKYIDLSINKVNGFDILTLSNSCDKKPKSDGTILQTTKAEKRLHGLGIKSIKNIVNKYNGDFEWSFDDSLNEFTVYITFNCKKD